MQNDQHCNNCGKKGHIFHQCKMPITSIGIIVFRKNNGKIEFLMIRRRDTLGYIDFMRGKYLINNADYIINMIKQMTIEEKNKLKTLSFDELWKGVWGNETILSQFKLEEASSREKFNILNEKLTNNTCKLHEMIDKSSQYEEWAEPEWGFPKGRRNYQEKDYDCALREFTEETGFKIEHLHNIQNILPFEEIFTGSNYKSYKHKYYLTYIENKNTVQMDNYQRTEVSKMEWKTYEECMSSIRQYNLEKKRLITNIYKMLTSLRVFL